MICSSCSSFSVKVLLKREQKSQTSFGPTAPPFLDYLKNILRRYPDGGQILKELIQNADDGQATEVVFIHDERRYGTESLWTNKLGKYQGPALYAYNNAAFTEEDWERIQMAGRSGKVNDPNKIGRFGIGFNSVYHITDVPIIFSSGHLGVMDPQENIFGERNGGFLWSLEDEEHKEALMTMHDQFQPFRDIVSVLKGEKWAKIMEDEHFAGTLFRFPLRDEISEISDNLYNSGKVVELFDSFIADAELSLLFLRSLRSVSLLHISCDGTVKTRLEVKASSSEVPLQSEEDSDLEGFTRFKQIILKSEDYKETQWLVTTCTMKKGIMEDLDVLAEKLSFVPRVDLAFPSSEQREHGEGRLSCFLPLPNNDSNKTGLPVHVNACFGLTDNRRHLKWKEEDQKHDKHALWNELLVNKVLPKAFVVMIQDAIKLCQESRLPVSSVYRLWPDISHMQHKDKWLEVARDVFDQLFRQDAAVLSLAKDERWFIPLSDAIIPSNGSESPDIVNAVKRTLVFYGENLVTVPDHVMKAIVTTSHTTPKQVTPGFLRRVLLRNGMQYIDKEDKLCLLEFVLSDENYKELQGLQLLPLSDGSFRSFTNREEDTALIDTKEFPRTLLPCCKHLFISNDLSSTCKTYLKKLASKNFFNVIILDAYCVAEYTRRYLPHDWRQTEKALVSWNIGSSEHPPSDWIHQFWKFLNSHFKDLNDFTEIPLMPISPLSNGHPVLLAKLQQKTTLIFQKTKKSSLPDQIAQLVTKAGGTVVRENDWLSHADLDLYVLSPSPRSVLTILSNVNLKHLLKCLKSEPFATLEELKGYFSGLDFLSNTDRDLLLSLPLFQSLKGLCMNAKSKQAVLLTTSPRLATDLPLPDSYIQCTSKTDDRFLQLLKVKILGPAEAAVVLVEFIERKSCSAAETEKIMTWILQHGSILFSQSEVLKYRCRDLRFIQRNGEQTRVSSFFDPRVKTFGDIFEANFFPPAVYTRTEEMLESLTELGLKSKETDVKPEHLLQAAKMVEKLHINSSSEAFRRSQVLLGIMDSNDLLSVFSAEQLHQLKMIRWLQCDQPGHEKRQLMDESEKTHLYSPCEVRHTMYEDIVGLVMPLTDKLSERVSSKLGLKQMPPPEKVTENLLVLKSKAKEMTNPDTNADFKQKLHCIYRHMQEKVSAFVAVMDKKECWLWAHNQFASPQKLVLNYPGGLDLSSYIVKVPNEFLPYKKLLQEFGLRTSLSDKEVIAILYSIQKSIDERQQPFASPAEVKVSTEILCWIWRQKKDVPEDIPVLVVIEDEQFTLKPRSEALICDLGKDKLKECKFSIEEMYIVHEEIPIAAAEWLKIKFLSNHILAPESLGIEQYGQREPITTRIKNILKEYDEPNDIFKELIQNAEDAGADTCKFMIDFREHRDPPESLIDPGMSLCQGPCLWAFNNKQFTTEDWENIVKVGSASKETKVEKIGKFGLGFNTVYHVTDVPSILSGSRLLILDPNVTHLKKHIQHQTNPGIRLDLSQKRILDCFPGQFAQYEHIFDCTFSRQSPPEPYTGTLIKLPFRSEEEVLGSEISTKVFYKHDILALRDYFRENSKSYLLFLKNINTLSLQSISCTLSTPPKDGEMETIMTISKTVESLLTIEETSNSKQYQAVNSLQKIDAKCKDIIDSCTLSIIKMTSHEQFGEPEEDFWLLYNCFGTGASLEKVFQKNDTAVFSLPIGGVAVPLQTNPDTGKLAPLNTDFVGQAFCFLALPIHTGLPVNVNGAFAVMSNRKSLWQSGEKRSWNEVLLRDPVTTAYITALLALKKMSEEKQLENYCYHSFWPNREKVSDSFKPLVDEFYSSIAQQATVAQQATDLELFSDGERWCSMNNAMFLHESIEEDMDIGALAAQICKEHVNKPKCVVSLPVWLRNSFKQCGLHNVLQNNIMTWTRFYQEVVFENLDVIDPKSRNALVLHALDLNNKDINILLVHHPCIPTSNGQLQCVKKLVSPMGKVACLYEPKEGRLLGGTKNDFLSPKRIQRLLELGMTNDNLPLKEIALKAETITDTWKVNRKKAYEHLKCLLEILKKHMDDQDSCSWETLRITAFIPAFSPGDIKMEGKAKLYKPTEVFTDECSMLVNMIHPVLDSDRLKIHNADPVLEMLGLQRNPDSKTVLDQLKKASNRKGSTDTPMLHKIAYMCYKFLDQWISECDDIALFSQQANSFPFIFIGDTFVNVDQVAESDKFEAKPYLHIVPATFKSCRNLWESVGVAKTFTASHFQTVLHNIHAKYESKPLSKGDLAICLAILKQALHETDEINTDDCLIPNAKGVLQPASELFFNDSQWIPVSPSVTLCHEDIPRSMALHFGIQTIRHQTLEHFTDDNFSAFSFDFEQREELAVRIKNIISAYSSKKDILKELIQNADDAEATEIHFVWDKRQHGKEKTFGERWNHLQGPALCVFNNKVFSDEDLKGIQQLGEGGKRETLGKTGKFGVGFNSVYHLTDCPSILTGDKFICISDPNMKYIETQPNNHKLGIGYKLADTFKEMYDDVYRSFLPEQFLLEEGTMFRLPLRTEYSAKNSRISCQEVTEHDMRELCSALSDDPEGLILFLKNICKITVHEINNHSGKLQTIFAVEKSLAQENREEKDVFVKSLQDAFESQRPVTPHTVFHKTTVSTSNKRQSTWLIAEQFGSSKSRKTVFDKPPQGAIAALVSTKGADVSSPNSFEGRAFCSLPLPGVTGLPVHVNGNFEVDSGRKNLWKEDGQSQKLDWNEFLTQDVIAPLYAEMLHYIKQRIGVKTVSLASLETSFSASYLKFWPVISTDVSTEWHEMIHEVYRSIKEKGLDLIPVLRSSTRKVASRHIKEYTFDWCNLRETEITKVPYLTHCSDDMNNDVLEALGMKLVPSTIHMDKIWKSFKSAGIEVKNVSPAAVDFLTSQPLNDPTKTDEDLPLPLTDTLIRDKRRCSQLLSFCLKDPDSEKMKHNPNLLDGIPLLLTRDEVLRVFDSASPKLISAHENLFSDYKDNFADYETNKSHIKILEASNLVNSLTLPCAAKYLKPLIQQHLQKCDVDLDSGLHVPNEAMMQWLKSLWRFLSSEVKPQTSKKDGKAQTLEDVLKFFSDCCILPVVYTRLKNKRLLQRITNIRSVIKFTSETKITSILFKLGFLKLDYMFFNEVNQELLRFLRDELTDVNDNSSVLDQVCNIKHSEFSHLSRDDMIALQKFLQTGLSMSNNSKEDQRKLRSLPLFETVQGERVRIDGPKAVFVLNSTHLGEFTDLIAPSKDDNIFLSKNSENYDLSQMLNIAVLDDLEYFMKFILPRAHSLTENEILQSLKLLLLNYSQFSNYKDKIISTMKTVKLIRSSQGQMETASYFFDDEIELYQKMVSKDRFVPERFWTELGEGNIREELCKYHQAFAAQRNVVEIRSSLIKVDPKYQDLIWTSMPIIDLPVKITPPLLQMMKNIGAHEKPPPHLVTANMRNICQSPCSNEQQIKTRAEVFRSAYAFLQAVDFPAETLTDLPVVLVEEDTQLAKASDVCLSLKDDLEFRPYLHKIPPHDALFGEFFRKIGVKDAPTAGHFCSVLAAVHADSTEKQQLNANQLKTVKRAVEQLFNLLKAQGHAILADVEILYLPAVDGKLYSSSSLFYNDTTFETKRLEEALENKFLLLGKLSKCHLDCDIHEQHRLVQLLPSSLQPKMLTELTREEVIETLLKPCKFLTVCEFSGWFNQHLSSKELRHGLVCLLKDQSQGKVSQKEASEMCDRAFGSIQIICCESLATMLCMDNEQLDKTTRETDVFVRRKQHGCIVYLKHNEDMAPKVLNAINMALTKEMNLLLDHRLTSEHLQVLGQLLLCDDLQDVQKCLADNNIHDSVDTESVLFNPPDPGTEIPEEWHDALDMSFFNNFEKGEYVGYRFNDKYIYAVIAEETPGDAGRCSQRYKVDVGQNEFVEVSHLDLYQFKREKTTHLLSMELEPLAGAPPRSSNKSSRPLPASLSEAKSDIDKCLTALWSLPSEERQKGIKRLYLRWHPDKNPDSLELATEAFQYLLNRIDELTKGEGGQSSSWGNWDFSNFHEQWNREARYHRSSQERSFSGCNSNNFWTHYTNIPRPNKEEAQRWFRQARCDLDAAQKDSDGESTEWCLFKIHQAVEKALTAAEFKRTGQRTANSTISATAEKVSRYHSLLRDLPEIVDDLKKLGVDNRKTQYPSCHAFPHIPNGQFQSEDGLRALNKASELFSKIQTYIQ
uniref:HEPN domain-containing protein n=1 Tax=Oryzias latipes TaxID=8090 RepID=A0A3P9JZ95_ORYLA